MIRKFQVTSIYLLTLVIPMTALADSAMKQDCKHNYVNDGRIEQCLNDIQFKEYQCWKEAGNYSENIEDNQDSEIYRQCMNRE